LFKSFTSIAFPPLEDIWSANNTFLHKSSDGGKGDCMPQGGAVGFAHAHLSGCALSSKHSHHRLIKRSGKGLQRGIEKEWKGRKKEKKMNPDTSRQKMNNRNKMAGERGRKWWRFKLICTMWTG
jgi:hypothetical protein